MRLACLVVACGALASCWEGSRECLCSTWEAEIVQVPISSEEAAVSASLSGANCGEPQALGCMPARVHGMGCSGFSGSLYGDGTGRERTCNVRVLFRDGTTWESTFRWSREETDCCPLLTIQSDFPLIAPANHLVPDLGTADLDTPDLGEPADLTTSNDSR